MSALHGLLIALVLYIWWAKPKPKPKPKHALVPARGASNTLNGLPAELILLITKSLQPVDLLCFSLCSRWISMVIGDQRRNLRYTIEPQRLPLLYRLDRDLPDQFICHECCLLHKYDESRDFGLPHPFDFRPSHPCIMPDNMSKHSELLLHKKLSDHVAYRFFFVHLQLAMKRFYCDPAAGISTDSLFAVEVTRTTWTTTLFSCEARICCQPPALQLRVQDIILFHSDQEIKWGEDTVGNLLICHHQSNRELVLLMRRLADQFSAGKKEVLSSSYCGKCNTEYLVELRAFYGELAFVITRWIDLGSGIEPIDPRWTVHALLIPDKYPTSLHPSDMIHSPRDAFEKACGERNSLDYLRSRNLAYLKNGNYKEVMKRGWFFSSRWYLWQKNLS